MTENGVPNNTWLVSGVFTEFSQTQNTAQSGGTEQLAPNQTPLFMHRQHEAEAFISTIFCLANACY